MTHEESGPPSGSEPPSWRFFREGRENDVSGNGVTLDFDMLLDVLRRTSNDTRESLRIMAFNLDWQSRPSRTAGRRMLSEAGHLAQITELLWVLQSMDADQDGNWPEKRWPREPENGNLVGFQLTRRELSNALSDIEALGFAVVNDFSKESTETTGRQGGLAVKHCSNCGETDHNKATCRKKPKATRAPSAWNRYCTANRIAFKSGPRKGRTNFKAMAKAYREQNE